MTTQDQVDSFHQFASTQTVHGSSPMSLEELVQEWRSQRPAHAAAESDVAAIREALDEMRAGDKGEPAEDVIRELRDEFGLVGSE